MRKISSILMTVLLGALCLTGCGSTDNNTAADKNVSSAAVSSPAADAAPWSAARSPGRGR